MQAIDGEDGGGPWQIMFMAAVLIIRKCVGCRHQASSGEPEHTKAVHRIAVLCLMPYQIPYRRQHILGCLLALGLRFGFMQLHIHTVDQHKHTVSPPVQLHGCRDALQIRGYAVKPAARNQHSHGLPWLPLEQDPLYLSLVGITPYLILRIKPADEMHLFQPFLLHDIVETIHDALRLCGLPDKIAQTMDAHA